jgi:hypothetical protein
MSNNFTYSNPGVIEVTTQGSKPPCLENWKNDTYLKLENDKMSFTTTQWNFATARGTVFVSAGRWYYDLTIKTSGQARIGWCSQNYAPESNHVGCGSDQDSWGWDGSQQKTFTDEKKNSTGKTYGEYWNANDIIGTSIDFDLNEIRYYKNGKDMGVAFRANKFPALHPCISFYRGCQMTVNFGPTFKHCPLGYYGMNPTVNATQKKNLLNIFLQYHKKGASLSDSSSRDVMKAKGVMDLATELGSKSPMDPHLLLLAWKLRSKKFCEFLDNEWMVLWANEKASTMDDIKAAVNRWIKELEKNDANLNKSFYIFVFDYMRREKGEKCTALEKDDAVYCWTLLGFNKKFKFFPDWEKFLKTCDSKGINRDVWDSIYRLHEKLGGDIKKFDEDDFWPILIDDFVHDCLLK